MTSKGETSHREFPEFVGLVYLTVEWRMTLARIRYVHDGMALDGFSPPWKCCLDYSCGLHDDTVISRFDRSDEIGRTVALCPMIEYCRAGEMFRVGAVGPKPVP